MVLIVGIDSDIVIIDIVVTDHIPDLEFSCSCSLVLEVSYHTCCSASNHILGCPSFILLVLNYKVLSKENLYSILI